MGCDVGARDESAHVILTLTLKRLLNGNLLIKVYFTSFLLKLNYHVDFHQIN
jgi:hypothetical protein